MFSIDRESIIDTLERVLKREKEEHQEISMEHKKELDNRLESYKNNPNDVLDWKDRVKLDFSTTPSGVPLKG
ncbi:addiction module protein [Galbibacter sp.]|uniref:addiction module protein n=1 Tax=Galbibacter sp. TaxID=2918471 RepID=UPI003A8EBD93